MSKELTEKRKVLNNELELSNDLSILLNISRKYSRIFPTFSNTLLDISELFLQSLENGNKILDGALRRNSCGINNNQTQQSQQKNISEDVKKEVDSIIDEIISETKMEK